MTFTILGPGLGVCLFLGLLLALESGRRLGRRRAELDPEAARAGLATVEGAVFGLLGLLMAFTLSGAASRLDARRELVAQEANAIGTAWLRIDLVSTDLQPPLRDLFRRYLDSRLAIYRKLTHLEQALQEWERSTRLQQELWTAAVAATRATGTPQAALLLLPAVNEMIDITTTRLMATRQHPPAIIFVMLVALALGSSLLAGYRMAEAKGRSWLHMVGFAGVMSLTIYVTLDIEYPRLGLIRVDAADEVLVDLRKSMDR